MSGKLLGRAVLVFSLALWTPNSTAQQVASDKAMVAEMRRAIVAWMDCIECSHAELASVLRFDSLALPFLAAVLRDGPSPTLLAIKRAQYPSGSSEDLVANELARYSARHRMRAGIALAEMGTEQSLAEVRQAMASSTDERLKRRLGKVLENAEKKARATPAR